MMKDGGSYIIRSTIKDTCCFCGSDKIKSDFNHCPNCGVPIFDKEPEGWSLDYFDCGCKSGKCSCE
jgi:hypothetical protein